MDRLRKLEASLAGVFKDAPKFSSGTKDTAVQIWPWLALAYGALQLGAAWSLWRVLQQADFLDAALNRAPLYYNPSFAMSDYDKAILSLGILVVLINAVVLLSAFGKLKSRAKMGWDLLFLSSLITGVYAVIQIFMIGRGLSNFIFNIFISILMLYCLFQTRDQYGAARFRSKAIHTSRISRH